MAVDSVGNPYYRMVLQIQDRKVYVRSSQMAVETQSGDESVSIDSTLFAEFTIADHFDVSSIRLLFRSFELTIVYKLQCLASIERCTE